MWGWPYMERENDVKRLKVRARKKRNFNDRTRNIVNIIENVSIKEFGVIKYKLNRLNGSPR